MRLSLACLLLTSSLLVSQCASPASAENWPHWRGPAWNGSTTETNLPDHWSKTENVAWVASLPGRSGATPVIWDDSVFLPSPDADGQVAAVVHRQPRRQAPLAEDGRPRQRRGREEQHGVAFGRDRRQAGRRDVRHRRPGGLRFRRQATLVAEPGQAVRQVRPDVALWFQPLALPRQAVHRGLAAGGPQRLPPCHRRQAAAGIVPACASIRRRAANCGGRSARPTPWTNRRTPTVRRSCVHQSRRGDLALRGRLRDRS